MPAKSLISFIKPADASRSLRGQADGLNGNRLLMGEKHDLV